LFWAIFLPWGARYSVDSISNPSSEKSFFGVAVLGYLMLQFSLYFFSALMKTSPEWRTEGSALYFALNIDQMTWPVGKWLLGFPGLLKFLSLSTFYIELISPFLLLIPFKSNFFRMIFFILICSLHLCIASVLYVGLFYLIGVVTVIGLLSGSAMDIMEAKFKSFRRFAFLMFNGFSQLFNSLISFQLKIKINLPAFLSYQFKLFKNGFLYFVICFNLLWCIGNLPGANFKVNQNFHWFAYMFRLDQDWGMFAPEVFKEDGWYIYEAELEKNSKDSNRKIFIDINRDGKIVDYKKPENIIALFQDDRWRKFGEVWPREPDKVKKEFCRYLKNKWNTNNPNRRIANLNIVYMKEITKKNYIPSTPERTVVCDCENWN
ncbi:MAG: hypothetical protein ACK452_05660, partial [Bacteroidota bacterium]